MRLEPLRWIQRAFLLIVLLGAGTGGWMLYARNTDMALPAWLTAITGEPQAGPHIGLIAGHRGNDSGAVCDDGLTEAGVNLQAAEETARLLRRQGATVEILDEFDDRLGGYRADALVAIHADSCEVDFSGFKVASLDGGSADSQRLADCLWTEYEDATGLPRHASTITRDMTRYHAFREIARSTPAAIIEIGFLHADREVLTDRSANVAQGIAGGVACFLNPQEQTPE